MLGAYEDVEMMYQVKLSSDLDLHQIGFNQITQKRTVHNILTSIISIYR